MGPPKTKGSRTRPVRNHRHSISALRDTFSVEALVTSFPASGTPKMALRCPMDFAALHDMPLEQQLLAIYLASPGNGEALLRPVSLHTELPIMTWVMAAAPHKLNVATGACWLQDGAKPESGVLRPLGIRGVPWGQRSEHKWEFIHSIGDITAMCVAAFYHVVRMSLIKDGTQPSAQLAELQVVISALGALAIKWLSLHIFTNSWAIP